MVGLLFRPVIKQIIFIGLVAVSVLVFGTAVFAAGIYVLDWENLWTKKFVQIVPLPAAIVNGKFVRLKEWYELISMHESWRAGQTSEDLRSADLLPQQRQLILNQLIENYLVWDLAEKLGVVVAPPEVEEYFFYLLAVYGVDPKNSKSEVEKLFGVPEERFKQLVVAPDLRKTKLQMVLFRSASSSEAYRQAEFVRSRLVSGMDFAKAAAEYSEDEETRFIAGELGFFSRRDLPPWFGDAVFELEPGQVSEIVVSPEGYHIFELASRQDDENPETVQLRQILIKGRPTVEDYLSEQRKNYRIWVFDAL